MRFKALFLGLAIGGTQCSAYEANPSPLDPTGDGGNSTPPTDAAIEIGDADALGPVPDAIADPASCRDVHARNPSAPSGVYSIRVGADTLAVYCEMAADGGGYTLVTRISAGVAGDPYALYTTPPHNDDVAAEATPLATRKHYVSRLITKWNGDFPVERIRVHVYDASHRVARAMTFDGAGTTAATWFSLPRLKDSPWIDVTGAATFSVEGDTKNMRRFMIHRAYGTCETDAGWLIVRGTGAPAACEEWELPVSAVRIFYASGTAAQNWNEAHGEGKSFAVFVR